jgi:hypothetical protein
VNFKPRFKESLQDVIARYDEMLEEMEDFDIQLTELDKISFLVDSLNDEDRLLAVTVQENCKHGSFDAFKGRLVNRLVNLLPEQAPEAAVPSTPPRSDQSTN